MQSRGAVGAALQNPPRDGSFDPKPKPTRIVSIGTVHRSGHKKQHVMIRAFRDLCDAGLAGWTYRLLGAIGPTAEDRDYFESMRALAEGYPVEILTDVPGEQLKSELEHASLFWHAMGYGVDEKDPGYFEHFGMVVTEAMAAGSVPIVFSGGGLPEIVTDGRDGYLWSTVAQLGSRTLLLAHNHDLRAQLAAAACASCSRFSEDAFERRLLGVLAPVLHG